MGTELALHLLADHELTVWNRTASRTQRLLDAGAKGAATPEEAISGAEIIITSLFGPDTVREVVLGPGLIPEGITWVDTTTVSPADADEFAAAVPSYVHAPVVGTLGPARQGSLGVYVGTPEDSRRQDVMGIVAPWADPERLRGVDSAAKAATAKLIANLALAISGEGLREALDLGNSRGLSDEEILDFLQHTGLAFIAGMKGPFVRGEREITGGDFSVKAIAKDARLMLQTSTVDLPAIRASLASLEEQEDAGHADDDFSSILVNRERPREQSRES